MLINFCFSFTNLSFFYSAPAENLKDEREKSFFPLLHTIRRFLGGTSGKEPTCQGRRRKRTSSIPGSERSLGGVPGNPLQYSCLENPHDRGAWQATVHRVSMSSTTEAT